MSAIGGGSYRGLAYGPGTKFAVRGIEGLDDLPDVVASDVQRPQDDGTYTGPDYSAARIVRLTLGLRGDDPADLGVLVNQARDVFVTKAGDYDLTVKDGLESVTGRVRRRSIPYDATALWRIGEAVIEFYCPDPRVWIGAPVVGATGMADLTGGMGFNTGFNLSFGGAGQTGGTVFAPNVGNTDGLVELVITPGANALVNPVVEHVGVGFLYVDATIGASDTLTIRPRDRLLLLNGAPRRDLMRLGSVWPSLPPGGATYRLGAGAPSATATLTVTSRSARL